jgi:hypothetical protein
MAETIPQARGRTADENCNGCKSQNSLVKPQISKIVRKSLKTNQIKTQRFGVLFHENCYSESREKSPPRAGFFIEEKMGLPAK